MLLGPRAAGSEGAEGSGPVLKGQREPLGDVSTVGLQVRAVICAKQWEGEWPAVAGRGVETGVGRTGSSVLRKLFRKLAVPSDP